MQCLDEEIGAKMILYGLGKLNTAEAKAFEDHLWACSYCTEKWYEMEPYLEDLSQNREEFRQQLRAVAAEKEAAAQPMEPKQQRGVLSWLLAFRPAWQLAAALLLVVGLTSGLFFYYMKQEPGFHQPSTGERSPIHLIEPLGDIDHAPETFRWERIPRAQYYHIKIRNLSTGTTLLERRSNEPRLVLPGEFKQRFQADRSYSWTVEAYDEKGRVVGSNTGYFKPVRRWAPRS